MLLMLTRWSVWTLWIFLNIFCLIFRLQIFNFWNFIFDLHLQWSFNAMGHLIHATNADSVIRLDTFSNIFWKRIVCQNWQIWFVSWKRFLKRFWKIVWFCFFILVRFWFCTKFWFMSEANWFLSRVLSLLILY